MNTTEHTGRLASVTDAAAPGAIRARGLRFRYPGASQPAVDGIDLHVAPGEILALLGPSGAGKSTTQHLLTGRLRGGTGHAELLGRDLAAWRQADYARIGISFEEPAVYTALTAREQLTWFAGLVGRPVRDVDELLDALGLADAADIRAGAYSKGMRVRLDLARALQHGPEVLFCDEPTSGLDPVSARRVRALIRAEADRGAAVLLTTHDMVTAEILADRVALVVDGRVAAMDSPRALKLRDHRPQVRVERRIDGRTSAETLALDDPRLPSLLRSGAVETLHTTEPTLEDVFVELTGRRLR